MIPAPVLSESYPRLLKRIQAEIQSARRKIEYVKAVAYWKIGDHISKHLLTRSGRAGYGERLYQTLAEDLKIGQRTLERTVQFRRAFPIPSARTQLDWTHYRALLSVDDPLLRNRLLKAAERDKLTTRQLAGEIRQTRKGRQTRQAQKALVPKRGRLYIYRLVDVDGALEVDCGFHVTRALPLTGLKAAKSGDLIISEKTRYGFTFSGFQGTRGDLYTYTAGSIRVVDGDTLSCRADCGFKTKVKLSLRLRGIDAPELRTAAGRAAKRFAQRRLKGQNEIIFRSYGVDQHGRYVADVFTKSADERQIYLNQELLDYGFAERY